MITCKNYINGKWVPIGNGSAIESFNPATGEPVGIAPNATHEEILEAISSARNAFEHSNWAEDSQLRTRALNEFAVALRDRQEELGRVLTDENGKVIHDATYEVDRGAGVVEYYAGLAQNVFGNTSMPYPDFYSFVVREPIGVIAVIVPFNFPVVLMLRSLAPALAAGNAVIIKPASYTPAISYELFKVLSEIEGIPPGIVSLVSGKGSVVGAELCTNPAVDMIALTGSSDTGKQVMKQAADTLKKVSLELGGKSPNVILKDADLKKAAQEALKGAWVSFGGQVCYSGTRILLEDSIHDEFVDILKKKAKALKLGYGANPEVDMGPVIAKSPLESVMEYIDIGRKDADLITGGFVADEGELSKGNFVAPTVFANVPVGSRISQEEVFGPVVSVLRFKDLDEAASIANSTIFGLAGAVWTRDISKALWLARRIKSGTVWVNCYGKLPYQAEMGGFKQSGIGCQYGEEGIHEFTQMKHIGIDIAP